MKLKYTKIQEMYSERKVIEKWRRVEMQAQCLFNVQLWIYQRLV